MPIKPENKARYPKNWSTEIRPAILDRANHKCEICGVDNYAVGFRDVDQDGLFIESDFSYQCKTYKESKSMADELNVERISLGCTYPWIVIVLTIMHLDHTPENSERSNLKAACQKCHLNYDQKHHIQNSAKTRRLNSPQADLLDH